MYRYRNSRVHLLLAAFVAAGLALAGPARAQEAEEEEPGWTNRAELSLVATGGNSEASTLGLRYSLTGPMGAGKLTIDAGALRAETTTTSRFALGTANAFAVQESSESAVTAENYFLRGRYDQEVSERLFWFVGAGWDRNEFAGIRNRLHAVGGIGHNWWDDDSGHFRTDYGLSYTDQEEVVDDPTASDTFLGLRLGWDYLRNLGASTSYGNVLIVDANADETSDYRADMLNSLAVSMSERLALQVSLQLLYDNDPSLTAVPLFSLPGTPSGATVLVPLDSLDTLFTVALVIDF